MGQAIALVPVACSAKPLVAVRLSPLDGAPRVVRTGRWAVAESRAAGAVPADQSETGEHAVGAALLDPMGSTVRVVARCRISTMRTMKEAMEVIWTMSGLIVGTLSSSALTSLSREAMGQGPAAMQQPSQPNVRTPFSPKYLPPSGTGRPIT